MTTNAPAVLGTNVLDTPIYVEIHKKMSSLMNSIRLFRFLCRRDCDGMQLELAKLIDGHELHCLNVLSFYVNPLTQQLEAICNNCDYFGII